MGNSIPARKGNAVKNLETEFSRFVAGFARIQSIVVHLNSCESSYENPSRRPRKGSNAHLAMSVLGASTFADG